MPTIAELVKEHSKVPGDIRIRLPIWDTYNAFRPFYLSVSGWHGLREHDSSWCYPECMDDGWQLYTEPKPKVMRAQYLIEPIDLTSLPFITDRFFKDDDQVAKHHGGTHAVARYTRLDEREFDR